MDSFSFLPLLFIVRQCCSYFHGLVKCCILGPNGICCVHFLIQWNPTGVFLPYLPITLIWIETALSDIHPIFETRNLKKVFSYSSNIYFTTALLESCTNNHYISECKNRLCYFFTWFSNTAHAQTGTSQYVA